METETTKSANINVDNKEVVGDSPPKIQTSNVFDIPVCIS